MDSKITDLKTKLEDIILRQIGFSPKDDDENLVDYPISHKVKMAVEEIIEELIGEKII